MKALILAVALGFLAAPASPHTRVSTSDPVDGAVLAAAPESVSLEFANPIRLTRVELAIEDNEPVEFDLGSQTSFATQFVLPLVGKGEGTYKVSWRGLSTDGHVMQGEFSFLVE